MLRYQNQQFFIKALVVLLCICTPIQLVLVDVFTKKIKIKIDHVSQLKMTEGLANQFTCCSCIPSKYLWSATVLGRLFNKIFPGIQCVHYQPGKVTCEDENIYTESKLVIKWCFMDVSEGIERNLLIDEDVIKLLQRIVDREAYSNQRDLFWSGKKKGTGPKEPWPGSYQEDTTSV